MGESGATNTNVCVNIGSYDKIHMPNNQMLPDARLSRKQRVARGLGNGINVLAYTRSRTPTHAHAHARPHIHRFRCFINTGAVVAASPL